MVARRMFIRRMMIGVGLFSLFPEAVFAEKGCLVEHPFSPPRKEFKGQCHNCGMKRPMWARTWHTYSVSESKLEVCSLHCLAESSYNSGNKPENVQVALYMQPEKSMDVDKVFYVLGSQAPGTMTMRSKLAFPSRAEADSFVESCGGTVVTFGDAYKSALLGIKKENKMINDKRVSKGKIVEPVDNKNVCPVCGMFPARYPDNKCQLQSDKGEVIHFCATQCLFEFLQNPQKYEKAGIQVKYLWVVDYNSGNWIYGRNAYYVVNTPVLGPMGKEAFPFVNLSDAKKFAGQNAGKILRFEEVVVDIITGK